MISNFAPAELVLLTVERNTSGKILEEIEDAEA